MVSRYAESLQATLLSWTIEFPRTYLMGLKMSDQKNSQKKRAGVVCDRGAEGDRVCPVCRGKTLIEIRGKLQCERCHTICETCCEGGRG